MDTEELTRYKNMSVNEIAQRLVPDIEDIKNKKKWIRFLCTLWKSEMLSSNAVMQETEEI